MLLGNSGQLPRAYCSPKAELAEGIPRGMDALRPRSLQCQQRSQGIRYPPSRLVCRRIFKVRRRWSAFLEHSPISLTCLLSDHRALIIERPMAASAFRGAVSTFVPNPRTAFLVSSNGEVIIIPMLSTRNKSVTTNHIHSLADQTREWKAEGRAPTPAVELGTVH
jgi:hypothetical protein